MIHIADFSSLGGVQSYLVLLKKATNATLISTKKPNELYRKYCIDLKNIFNKEIRDIGGKQMTIHNLALAKMWPLIILSSKLMKYDRIYYHEHGSSWHDPQENKKRLRNKLKDVDGIIANSDATKKLLQQIYKIKKEITVAKSPVLVEKYDIDNELIKRKKENLYTKDIVIGYLGRQETHKNPIFVIELADRLVSIGYKVKVELVGSGELNQKLKEESKKRGLTTVDHGRVNDWRPIVRHWDLCLAPSLREPLGLVPAETATVGTLCIASNIDGLPEMYPSNLSNMLIDMIEDERKTNKALQYDKENNTFRKNMKPDLLNAIEIVQRISQGKIDYIESIKKHIEYIDQNLSIKEHCSRLKLV